MNTAYWAGEFVKVLLAYVVLMYVWPSVLFRKHLKGKSRIPIPHKKDISAFVLP